jgi:hypothetical protein
MSISKKLLALPFVFTFTVSSLHAQVDSNFYCFLLFGQSNMAGGYSWRSGIIKADCDTNPRVKSLAFSDCPGTNYNSCNADSLFKLKKARTYNQWYTAFPPLHDCGEGICPGEYFAKTLLDSLPDNIKIGFIPCALSGMALDVFLKGCSDVSTVGPPAVNGKNAYQWLIDRCQLAQKTGVIKGMLLHQGESGVGSKTSLAWDACAIQIFNDLKNDLKLDKTTPVVIGELRSDNTAPAPNNTNFNKMVDGIPAKYANCAVASSQGLSGNGLDVWHFTSASFREFGKRYAKALLSVASPSFIPRKNTSNTVNERVAKVIDVKSATSSIKVYTLNGRVLHSYAGKEAGSALRRLNTRGVYIVSRKFNDGRTAIVPFINE